MAAQSPRHPALADASPTSYWLDRPDRPKAEHPLESDEETELVVVGAGFAGLWTALLAREADPQRDVVLRAVDEEGLPWPAAVVRWFSDDAKDLDLVSEADPGDEEGVLRLSQLPPGRYSLELRAPGSRPRKVP